MHVYELILEKEDTNETLGQFTDAFAAREEAAKLGAKDWSFPYKTNDCYCRTPNGTFRVKKVA